MRTQLRLRKFSPIDREHPVYEIIEGDEVLFDVSRNDAGEYEFGAHAASSGRVLPLLEITALVEEAKKLLEEE